MEGGVVHQRAAAPVPTQRPLHHGGQRRRGRRRLWRITHEQLRRRDGGALAEGGTMVEAPVRGGGRAGPARVPLRGRRGQAALRDMR